MATKPVSPSPSPLLGGASPTDAMPGMAGVGGADGSGADSSPTTPPAPPSFTDKMLSEAQGRFDAVKKVYAQLGRIEKGLTKLTDKGDSVTEDDVLDEMANLVAHGADPKNLAAMIAGNTQAGVGPMPPSGEPLAGWLKDAEEKIVGPAAAQLRSAMALAQHQLGVAAAHHMIDNHAKAAGAASPPSLSPALAPPQAGGTTTLDSPSPSPLLH